MEQNLVSTKTLATGQAQPAIHICNMYSLLDVVDFLGFGPLSQMECVWLIKLLYIKFLSLFVELNSINTKL